MYKNINYPQHCNECILCQEGLYVNEFTLQCPQYYHGIKSSAASYCRAASSLVVSSRWRSGENRGNGRSWLQNNFNMSDTVANEPEELWLPPEEEERLTELFNQLDVNKDGRIDVNDLGKALDQMQVPQIPGQAQVKSYSIFEINKKSISICYMLQITRA